MPSIVSRTRDVDSVLLRLPSSVKQRAVTIAHSANVSQNAFYAAAVLTSAIMLGPVPELGSPENLRALASAIDAAIADPSGFPAYGAFHRKDWEDVHPFVEMLEDLDVLCDVRFKVDAKTPDAVVYSFTVKKVGRAVWPALSESIRHKFNCIEKVGPDTTA